MSKKQYLCATSIGALAAAALISTPSFAQPREPEATEVDEVVVTGSFIPGTPEDAVVPVEAVTLQELRQQGSPSNLDLVKSLSEVGSVAGEANRSSAFAIGAQTINLRGVSSSRTVVVFNGRRLPEQFSSSVGRFNNIAIIPNAAIGRVEVLKDGGATTFGADAVGGVVNYITRRNLDGVEMNANYRYIEDSDGDWDVDVSMGKVSDRWNAMLVLGYQHRSELDAADRDWAVTEYLENPAGWSATGSPSAYAFQRQAAPGVFSTITPFGVGASRYTGDRQMGASGLVRDPFCSQLGGFAGWSATPSPLCYIRTVEQANLVEEQDTYQAYGEFNYEFDNGLRVHLEGLYYGLDIPHIPIDAFGNTASNFPLGARPAPTPANPNPLYPATTFYSVPGHNPAVRALLDALTNQNGTPAFGSPTTPGTQAFQILNGGRVTLNSLVWRPFGLGGNPAGDLDFQHNFSDTFRGTFEVSGELPEVSGFKLRWSAAATYNYFNYEIDSNDILVDRMQAALNGLGGPGCQGATPGANGCGYFNPFSSAIAQNIYTGQTNPGYQAGLANDPALVEWMYVPVTLDRTGKYFIGDFILNGETPFRLWADDPIAFAVGGQYRRYREITKINQFGDRLVNPCSTLGVQDCASRTGPLLFNRAALLFGLSQSSDRTYPVRSAFFEVQAPVFNNLVVNVSGRYEKFYSDVSDVNNDVFVPAGSIRWQVNDWLALRATAGKTFSQVNPPEDVPPILAANVSAPAQYGGTAVQFSTANYPNLEVQPEEGFNFNIGSIVQVGNFRANLDYYNIEIDNLIRGQTSAQIVNALVQPGQSGAGALINCSSPLLSQEIALFAGNPFVQLNGPCVQGQSALNSTGANGVGGLAGGVVNFFGSHGTQTALVNGQTLRTSGLDFAASYRWEDVLGGQLTVSVDATHILTYETTPYIVAGIEVAPGFDGIGQFNELTGRNSQHIAEDRGSITVNFRRGRHNINWSTRMVGSFINDDLPDFQENAAYNLNQGDASGRVPTGAACVDTNPVLPPTPSGAGTGEFGGNTGASVGYCSGQNATILAGQKLDPTFTTDLSYQVELPWDTVVTVTVQNLFDAEPQFSRDFLGYDAFTGSPLGRTFRFGVRKTF